MSIVDLSPRWNALRPFGNSVVVRASIIVPFVGYFILFNQQIVDYLAFHTDFCASTKCSVSWRIYYLYFGSCALALGSVLYLWRCPPLIRHYDSAPDFFDKEKLFTTAKDNLLFLIRLVNQLKPGAYRESQVEQMFLDARESGGTSLADIMKDHYYLRNRTEPATRTAIVVLYALGVLLLLVPTLATFWQVLQMAFGGSRST